MFLCHGNRILVAAKNVKYVTVLGIMFLSLPDPDPLVRGLDPDPDPALDPDPSIIMKKNSKKNLDS